MAEIKDEGESRRCQFKNDMFTPTVSLPTKYVPAVYRINYAT
jgi:hypothetical protein